MDSRSAKAFLPIAGGAGLRNNREKEGQRGYLGVGPRRNCRGLRQKRKKTMMMQRGKGRVK